MIWLGSSCPTLSRSTPSSATDGRSSRGGQRVVAERQVARRLQHRGGDGDDALGQLALLRRRPAVAVADRQHRVDVLGLVEAGERRVEQREGEQQPDVQRRDRPDRQRDAARRRGGRRHLVGAVRRASGRSAAAGDQAGARAGEAALHQPERRRAGLGEQPADARPRAGTAGRSRWSALHLVGVGRGGRAGAVPAVAVAVAVAWRWRAARCRRGAGRGAAGQAPAAEGVAGALEREAERRAVDDDLDVDQALRLEQGAQRSGS